MKGLHLIILGPPGAGKGTQAARIARELDLEHLSTGDMLREAVAAKTELGGKAEGFMKSGLLVPDEIMLGLIREQLAGLGDRGWILDGFPRTIEQAEALSSMLEESGIGIDRVLLIEVDPEIVVRRGLDRRICKNCKAVYNLSNLPGGEKSRCEKCGGELVKRPDDEEGTIRRRLEIYEKQTRPVVEFFQERGGLATVDGSGEIDDITAELIRAIK